MRRSVRISLGAAALPLALLGIAGPAAGPAQAHGVTARHVTAAPTAPVAPRPLPRAWRAAVDRLAASSHRAAPADTQDFVTFPSKIVIGGPTVTIPYRVDVGTTYQTPAVGISLQGQDGTEALGAYMEGATNQQVFTGNLRSSSLGLLFGAVGPATFYIVTGEAGGSPNDQINGLVPTTIGLRSILAENVTRIGTSVRVVGATKAYFPPFIDEGGYQANEEADVHVQRYTSSGWVTLRTVPSDDLGHIDTTLRIPFRTAIRLVVDDDFQESGAFGAVTAAQVL